MENSTGFKDILTKAVSKVYMPTARKLKISIPIIQRDYAQGRMGNKAADIRNKFLDEILNRLKSDESLFLDFIYGSIEDDKFIPIDGQQRLTTLFLLHLYFAKKEDKGCEYLRRFTYETRSSSREFCEKLVDYDIDFSKEKISTYIKDSNWFMPFWENDPTVKSMLVMIDEIHHKFKDAKFYDKLENIKFSFLELKDFGLTDDLYIKMNARGKPLSEFENFKAEFEKKLSQGVKSKLDNQWLDLFWGLKDSNKGDIDLSGVDKRYMAFFNRVASNFAVFEQVIKEPKDLDGFNALNTLNFFSANEKGIEGIIKILDELCKMTNNELLKEFTDTSKDITYETRAKFFALSAFLINFGAIKLNGEFYQEYKRITTNIAKDFNIDSILKLRQVFEFINEICKKCKKENIFDLLDGFDDKQPDSFKRIDFYKWQEKKKLKLMQIDERWIEAINEAEKHWHLGSNLTFLMEFAGYDVEKFKEYYKKFNEIFKEDKENFLFQRALLTKGNYLINRGYGYGGEYLNFCNFNNNPRDKDDNWRSVFFDEEESEFLKELLNDGKILQDIIDDFNDKDDWRYYFIKYPAILRYCEKFFIQKNGRMIRILTKTLSSSYHVEYYSYALFIILQKELSNLSEEALKYVEAKSSGEICYIDIGGHKISFMDIGENKYGWDIDEELFENMDFETIKSKTIKIAEGIQK